MKESNKETKPNIWVPKKTNLHFNYGGFSWKRFFGISAYKAKISRKIGVPLTHSGRQRKLGAFVEKGLLALGATIIGLIYAFFNR